MPQLKGTSRSGEGVRNESQKNIREKAAAGGKMKKNGGVSLFLVQKLTK